MYATCTVCMYVDIYVSIHAFTYMYVCMYVLYIYMCVSMQHILFVCMYVCMYEGTGWHDGVLAEALSETSLGEQQSIQATHSGRHRDHAAAGSLCMYVCIYVCVCMYVFMYVCMSSMLCTVSIVRC